MTDGTIVSNGTAMKGSIVMAKNRTYTGGRKSVGTPTLNKESYFQLIRMIRNSKNSINSKNSKNEGENIERTSGKSEDELRTPEGV